MEASIASDKPVLRTRVWQLPVVLCHWVMAVSVVVLAVTGYRIGNPAFSQTGDAAVMYDLGAIRYYHLVAGYTLTAAFLLRFYWGLVGNRYARWTTMLPLHRAQWRHMADELMALLWPRRRFHVYTGHAPLANVGYVAAWLGVALTAFTGLVMHAQAHYTAAWRWMGSVGLWFFGNNLNAVRYVHHVMLWFFVLFLLVHLYLVVYSLLVSHSTEIDTMISGNKFMLESEMGEGELHETDRGAGVG